MRLRPAPAVSILLGFAVVLLVPLAAMAALTDSLLGHRARAVWAGTRRLDDLRWPVARAHDLEDLETDLCRPSRAA